MKASELVKRLLVHVQQIRKARGGFKEVTPLSDDVKRAADLIEAQARAIEEMRGALERIAFEGISDREKLTSSAKDYIDNGGKYPNERTIAAYVLASHSKEGEQG